MNTILVQNSQSALSQTALDLLDDASQIVTVPDRELEIAWKEHGPTISGFVFFESSPRAIQLCRLVRNERLANPLMPTAYVGNEPPYTTLPFGCRRFDEHTVGDLAKFMRKQIRISALVVDDDEAIREVATLTLNKIMDVEQAADGEEAISMIKCSDYDLVLLDVMLPKRSGEEVFEVIKSDSPRTTVVVSTAYDTKEREFSFTLAGVDDYISKPFIDNRTVRQKALKAILSHREEFDRKQDKIVLDSLSKADAIRREKLLRYI